MKRNLVFLSFAVLLIVLSTKAFSGFGTPTNGTWYNTSWHYRIRIELNSTQNLSGWPIEQDFNFTDLLPAGTFDINSTRVFEHNQFGYLMQEVPSQFDTAAGYNASNNAVGTIVFMANGTTPAGTKRIFYVYYDTTEQSPKPAKTYPSNITYLWDGEEVHANNSLLKMYIDTNRSANTSGLYRAEDKTGNVLFTAPVTGRTAEYVEYYNGTNATTFDLRGNATFINGSVRLTIEQTGNETVIGDLSRRTNELKITKRYYIYGIAGNQTKGTFIKIYQKIENIASSNVSRNSTPSGALSFDLNRTLSSGSIDTYDSNSTNPFSWSWASGSGGEMLGIVNLNTSHANFTANISVNKSDARIGINLRNTTIATSSFIEQTAVVYLAPSGGSDATSEFLAIKNAFTDGANIVTSAPETWDVTITPFTNASMYNRNETVIIRGNVSVGDRHNLTRTMNATMDMGTAGAGDDITIQLYDEGTGDDLAGGDKIFAGSFRLPENATTGSWKINFTAYSNMTVMLNSTLHYFNVTDAFNVVIGVTNPSGLVDRLVRADVNVKNFRNDSGTAAANLSCTFAGVQVVNKTDMNNGTYRINFTAPSVGGTFDLFCNATRAGNIGNDTKNFTTEIAKTSMNISANSTAINITKVSLYNNQTFGITANSTNIGNATAYSANFTAQLLSGWSAVPLLAECGNVTVNASCQASFNITVPSNTSPGVYRVNITVTWTHPDNAQDYNRTSINVTVLSNPIVDVQENNITREAGDGTNTGIGNFTILSVGNIDLQNITISCASGTVCQNFAANFSPPNASLSIGQNLSVQVNVSVPLNYTPGTYNGTVNVSSANTSDVVILYVIVAGKTNLTLQLSPSAYTSNNITQTANETFSVQVNVTNAANGSARFVNISMQLPQELVYSGVQYCDNLTKNQQCSRLFNMTVLNATPAGSYSINVTAGWTNNDNSVNTSTTVLVVTVASNSQINVSETLISGNASDGATSPIGNFTVLSVGNDPLQNVSFSCASGAVCQNFTLVFVPANVSSIAAGQNYTVSINVTVPSKFQTGTYSGTVNVSASGYRSDAFVIEVNVSANRSWTMAPAVCQRSEFPDEGTVCNINITNTGNDAVNFTITPISGNYTTANVTNFTVGRGLNYTFSVTYNVTNVTQVIYNTTFTVDALQAASPDYLFLNISLLPYLPPLIDIFLTPDFAAENTSIRIDANVTDRSGAGILFVKINITAPNGTSDNQSMSLLNQSGNLSQWRITYTNTAGRGIYRISVSSEDNIGNAGNSTANLSIHIKLATTLTTLTSSYLQGDTGSAYFSARNNGTGVQNVSVTLTLKDPNGNVSYSSAFKTNSDGIISPLPTFTMPSDAVVGNYTLFANYTYNDTLANRTVNNITNHTFLLKSRTITVTGLFADIETAVVWYPDNTMRLSFFVYNGEGKPTDPTEMKLIVYDPAENVYFSTNLSSMTKKGTGYYSYSYAMPSSTASGMYLAMLNATQSDLATMKFKAFRVAKGGPYDVRINVIKNEVEQGGYLDFTIFIENKGEVSQDVFIEYKTLHQNTAYFSTSEYVYTPAVSNQSFSRNAFIYSTQPLGTHTLNVKVTYDSVQPPLEVNATFIVIAKAQPTPTPVASGTKGAGPGAGGGGGTGSGTGVGVGVGTGGGIPGITGRAAGAREELPEIIIEKYNRNISLAKGLTKIENVVVKNVGDKDMDNLSVLIVGIPLAWYNITPQSYKTAQKDNSYIFLIEFRIPKDAKEGEYKANLIASTNMASDQKAITITIFKSIEDVLNSEISRLKEDLQELAVDVKIAERDGKDTSAIAVILNEIKSQINSAETNLKNKNTDEALGNVANAKILTERARSLLGALEAATKPQALIPLWGIVGAGASVGAVSVFVYLKKRKKVTIKHINLLRLLKSLKGKEVSKDELTRDHEKLTRMLDVVEKERREGIISANAYKEMKKSIEGKMEKIGKKLK